MESFGLWYVPEYVATVGNDINKPYFDLHANFWSENIKVRKGSNNGVPYIDIGIRIYNWINVAKIIIHCPFELNSDEIDDLSMVLKDKDTDEQVFNCACDPVSSGEYNLVRLSDQGCENKILLFPLSFRDGEGNSERNCNIEESYGYKGRELDKESDFVIDFRSFKKLYSNKKSKIKPKDFDVNDSIYIRFRIKTTKLQDKMYFDSNPYNKSLESAFTSTRIVDFKINEDRNLSTYTSKKMDKEKSELAAFRAVHFLAMVPSHNTVEFFPGDYVSCRELERGQWDKYYGAEIDSDKEHILAYHSRTRKGGSDNERISSFSSLVRITSYQSNIKTVLIYMLIVIVLSVIGGAILNLLVSVFGILSEHMSIANYGNIAGIAIGVVVIFALTRRHRR